MGFCSCFLPTSESTHPQKSFEQLFIKHFTRKAGYRPSFEHVLFAVVCDPPLWEQLGIVFTFPLKGVIHHRIWLLCPPFILPVFNAELSCRARCRPSLSLLHAIPQTHASRMLSKSGIIIDFRSHSPSKDFEKDTEQTHQLLQVHHFLGFHKYNAINKFVISLCYIKVYLYSNDNLSNNFSVGGPLWEVPTRKSSTEVPVLCGPVPGSQHTYSTNYNMGGKVLFSRQISLFKYTLKSCRSLYRLPSCDPSKETTHDSESQRVFYPSLGACCCSIRGFENHSKTSFLSNASCFSSKRKTALLSPSWWLQDV